MSSAGCDCQDAQFWYDNLGWWPITHMYSGVLVQLFVQNWWKSLALTYIFESIERFVLTEAWKAGLVGVCENADDHLHADPIQHTIGITLATLALYWWDLWYQSEDGGNPYMCFRWLCSWRGWKSFLIWTVLIIPSPIIQFGYEGYMIFTALTVLINFAVVWAYGYPRFTFWDAFAVAAISAAHFLSFSAQHAPSHLLSWIHTPFTCLLLVIFVPRRPRTAEPKTLVEKLYRDLGFGRTGDDSDDQRNTVRLPYPWPPEQKQC